MAKRDKREVDAGLAEQFSGFANQADASQSTQAGVLSQLLEGADDDAEAVEPDAGDLGALQQEFETVARLTLRKKELERELSEVSKALTAQKDRMQQAMEGQGTQQFRGADGASCNFQTRFDTVVEDPEAFMEWVQERHQELLTVNSQTRTKFIRENYRDQGVDPDSPEFPPGLKTTERTTLVVRGVRVAKE